MQNSSRLAWLTLLVFAISVSFGVTLSIVKPESPLLGANLQRLWADRYNDGPVTMIFTGDIMLGRYIATLRGRNGGDFPFTYMPELLDHFEAELGVEALDLVVGNLEGPISDSTYVNPGTAMRFNFKPESAELLAEAGFTTLSLANNHALDQGSEGYWQSIDYLEAAGLEAFGHPDTHDGPYSFMHYVFSGHSVGLLGLHDVTNKLDQEATKNMIALLNREVDTLIIFIHWGPEYWYDAPQSIKNMAHSFVDNGADLIVGHHPHVIQGSETYKGAPIYYSLGNFVFDQYWSGRTQEGLVLGVRIDDEGLSTVEAKVDLVNQGEPKLRP